MGESGERGRNEGGPMIQSTATKYAIRAVCHLAHLEPGARAQAREISEALSIPQAFLSKILQDLSKKGLFELNERPQRGLRAQLLTDADQSLHAGSSGGRTQARGRVPPGLEPLRR